MRQANPFQNNILVIIGHCVLGLFVTMATVTSAGASPFAYVTNSLSNSVSVVDTATNVVVATVQVGMNPVGVAVSPDGTLVYVTNQTVDGSVSIISTSTNTVVDTVSVGPFPGSVAFAPDGKVAYVLNTSGPDGIGSVSAIDTNSHSLVATITVGKFPGFIAIRNDGAFAYVTDGFSDPPDVAVISLGTNTIVARVPVGDRPEGLAITPNGAFVYVANQDSNTMSVIDTATNTVVATTQVGINPCGVAITPNGAFAYVTNFNSSNVSVIDTSTNTVVGTTQVGFNPCGLVVTPNGAITYVANSAFFVGRPNISAISTLTNTVDDTILVGNQPARLATSPTSVAPPCTFSLDSLMQTFTSDPGLGSFFVSTTTSCAWKATTDVSWITLVSGTCQTGDVVVCPHGPEKVSFAVDSNEDGPRIGHIFVANQAFEVDQQELTTGCSFSISPSHAAFEDSGEDFRVVVIVPSGTNCHWTAESNAPWLTVSSGAFSSGNGAVILRAARNTGKERTGTATIAGQTFSATQGAGACGALDVSSQTTVVRSGLAYIPFSTYLYSQTITVTNTSGSVIHGPLSLVFLGIPNHQSFPDQVGIIGATSLTTCFSVQGDAIVLMSGSDLLPGGTAGFLPLFFTQRTGTGPQYSTKVLSGIPTK